MLSIGQFHTLKIDRDTPPGLFLKDDTGEKDNEVLLPNKYKPESFELEDEIEVFVYLDHDERPVATNLKPYVKLDEFAFLKCVEVNQIGAFLDWGLEKDLFLPFKEQKGNIVKGYEYLVYVYVDLKARQETIHSLRNIILILI